MTRAKMNEWRSRADRETAAYHEAGHVIADLLGGIPVRGVDMKPTAERLGFTLNDDMTGGLILAGNLDARPGSVGEHLALARIRAALAGFAAESIWSKQRGLPHDGPEGDVEKAAQYAGRIVADRPEKIRDLATRLIVTQQWLRVRQDLRRHWQHVTAVAARLDREDYVDADAIGHALQALPRLRPARLPRSLFANESDVPISG